MAAWLRAHCIIGVLSIAFVAGCGGGETAADSGETTRDELPAAATGEAEAGATVFAASGCSGCHTLAAAGATGQTGPNLDEARPDFTKVVDRVTNGAPGMPSFAAQLDEQEIRDVAAYVVASTRN